MVLQIRSDRLGLNQVYERGSWEIPFGNYTPGRFAWELLNPVALKKPVPAKGMLGIRRIPSHIERELRKAV